MIIQNSLELVKKKNQPDTYPMVLNGLKAAHIGMLISAPGVGKSRLALSLAIETASGTPIIGLIAENIPKRVLVISNEDTEDIVIERLAKCIDAYGGDHTLLKDNLDVCCNLAPLVIPPESNAKEREEHWSHKEKVKESFSQYDLVIIDTISETMGDCDEVTHDRLIKNTLSQLAKDSGAAILVVHHITKEVIRGRQALTMASGSGLSTLIRLSKYQLGLRRNNEQSLELVFLKHNYLHPDQAKTIALKESEQGVIWVDGPASLTLKVDMENMEKKEVSGSQPKKRTQRKTRRKSSPLDEPAKIEIKGVESDNIEHEEDVRGVL